MKKTAIIVFSLVLLLSIALTGCGSSKNTAETAAPSADATSAPTPAPTDTPKAAANDKTFTIRVGSWFIDDRTFMKDFVKNVEAAYKLKYPNATIQWDNLLSGTYFDKLKAQFASDSAPDVVFSQMALQLAEGGYLEDLSNEPWAADFNPAIKKAFTYHATKDEFKQYDGKLYGVSMGVGVMGIWYNKGIFTNLGLAAPKTVAEFMAANEKIKNSGIIPLALGFKDSWTATIFNQQWLQSYGYGVSESYGKEIYDGTKRLDGPEAQAVMKNFEMLKQKDYVNKNALSQDWPQSAEMFTSGKAAMIMQGSWMPAVAEENFTKKGHAKFELGFFPLMDDKGHTEVIPATDHQLSINAHTKLMQESKDLVAVILSPEIYAPYNNGSGTASALENVKVEYTNPVMNDVSAALASAKSHNNYAWYIGAAADTVMTEVVTKVISGVKFNPDDLKAAQNKFETDKSKVILPAE